MTDTPRGEVLKLAARQAANCLFNIAQFDRPLTERERASCREAREALDAALANILSTEAAPTDGEIAEWLTTDDAEVLERASDYFLGRGLAQQYENVIAVAAKVRTLLRKLKARAPVQKTTDESPFGETHRAFNVMKHCIAVLQGKLPEAETTAPPLAKLVNDAREAQEAATLELLKARAPGLTLPTEEQIARIIIDRTDSKGTQYEIGVPAAAKDILALIRSQTEGTTQHRPSDAPDTSSGTRVVE